MTHVAILASDEVIVKRDRLIVLERKERANDVYLEAVRMMADRRQEQREMAAAGNGDAQAWINALWELSYQIIEAERRTP